MEGTTPNDYTEPEKYWTDDFLILIRPDKLLEFFPTKNQTTSELLNSLTRLVLYVSITLSVYHKSEKYLLIFLAAAIIFSVLYYYDEYRMSEHFEKPNVTEPTDENPLMHRLNTEPMDKAPPIDTATNTEKAMQNRKKVLEKLYNALKIKAEKKDNIDNRHLLYQFYTNPSNVMDEQKFFNFRYLEALKKKDRPTWTNEIVDAEDGGKKLKRSLVT
jgi:hypothetical protein